MPLADDSSGVLIDWDFFTLGGDPSTPNIFPDPNFTPGVRELPAATDADNPLAQFSKTAEIVSSGVAINTNEWYLDQFWVSPQPAAYGNIVSDEVLAINILSTHRTAQQLTSFDEVALAALGITVTSGPGRPTAFEFLQTITWEFTAAGTHPVLAFDEFIDFTFDAVP